MAAGDVAPEASDALADLIGPSWNQENVCDRLVLTQSELNELTKNRKILVIVGNAGETLYPLFQFTRTDGGVGVRGVVEVALGVLKDMSAVTIATLLNLPAPELDELTPLEWDRAELDQATSIRHLLRLDSEWRSGADPSYRVRRRRSKPRTITVNEPDQVSRLTARSSGVWLVMTRAGRHVVDLDDMVISRVPDEAERQFDYNVLPAPITRVTRYPQVGEPAVIWVADPHGTGGHESWRVLVDVTQISRLTPNGSLAASTGSGPDASRPDG